MKLHPDLVKAILARRFAVGGPVNTQPSVNYAPGQTPGIATPTFASQLKGMVAPAANMFSTPTQAAAAAPGAAPLTPGMTGGGAAAATGYDPSKPYATNSYQANAPLSNLGFQQAGTTNTNYAPSIGGAIQGAQAANAGQTSLAQALQAQANGQGPSLAQSQLTSATQQGTNAVAGQVASQRGLNPALAARLAAQGQAAVQQGAAGQSAALRSQEQQAAQSQLGSVLNSQASNNSSLAGALGSLQNTQNANQIQNLTDQEKLQLQQNQQNQQAVGQAQTINATTSTQNTNNNQSFDNQIYGAAQGAINGAGAVVANLATGAAKTGSDAAGGGITGASGGGITYSGSDPSAPLPPSMTDSGSLPIPPSATDGGSNYSGDAMAHGGLVHALMARRYADGGDVAPDMSVGGVTLEQALKNQSAPPTGPTQAQFANAPALPTGAGVQPSATVNGIETAQNGVGTALNFVPVVGPLASAGWNAAAQAQRNGWNGPAEWFDPGLKGQTQANHDDKYTDKLTGLFNANGLSRGVDDGIKAAGDWIGGAANTVGDWFKKTFQAGGPVPGHAAVRGNSYSNDTVPALLSPGEIVLPRSVTQSQDPVKHAADFVAAIKKQGGGPLAGGPKSYGELLMRQRELHARLSAVEKKVK